MGINWVGGQSRQEEATIKLQAVLEEHSKWVKDYEKGTRASLYDADLCNLDLRGIDLHRADLLYANLRGADLRGVNLSNADLAGADLRWADLRGANLRETDLTDTNLTGADLRDTVLSPLRLPHDATAELIESGIPVIDSIAYAWRTKRSPFNGKELYFPGRYVAPVFSTCSDTPCHPGIYFATTKWLRQEYGYLIELVPCATWVSCVCAAEEKFRTKELWVFEEADRRWRF